MRGAHGVGVDRRATGDVSATAARQTHDRRAADQALRHHAAHAFGQIKIQLCVGRIITRSQSRLADNLARIDVRQIVTRQIRDGQLAENIIQDRRRVLDRLVALHEAGWFEPREGESFDILFQRHAVLQPERNRDGEIVHERAEGGALFVHVDEDFAQTAVIVFAGAEINLMTADGRFLRVALAAAGKLLALLLLDVFDALDDPFHDPLGDDVGARRHRRVGEQSFGHRLAFVVLDVEDLRVERLR